MTAKTLAERVQLARYAVHFAKVAQRNSNGQASKVLVPGSEMKRYETILRRNGCIECECNLETGSGYNRCNGNSVSICYHSICALIVAAETRGKVVSFCEFEDDARRLAHTGGDAYQVKSSQSQKSLWMVVKDTEEAAAQKAKALANKREWVSTLCGEDDND